MALRSRLKALTGNSFFRSASVLVGGTATAQVLTILALPVLTRLYSPEEFSLLAVYVAILTMVQVIACMRLEIAIPLPEDDVEAANLMGLAILSTVLVAVVAALAVLFGGSAFFTAIGQPEMQPYGWLLPFGIWLAGSYAALQYWSTRKKHFPVIARTRIVQVGSGLTAQLGLGWAGAGPIGLMLGHALMAGAGILSLARQAFRMDSNALRATSATGMRRALRAYQRFPLYSTWEALANNAGMQLPVLLIATLALGPEAGFVLLATRAIGTPVNMIGSAAGQVYLSRAPEEMRAGRLPEFTLQILRGIALIGIAPLVVAAVIAPAAFALIFGEEWRRAGELVTWMMPWFVLKLLSSPVSMVMHINMKQQAMLWLTVVGLVLRVALVLFAHVALGGHEAEAFAVGGAVFYAAAMYIFCQQAGIFSKRLKI